MSRETPHRRIDRRFDLPPGGPLDRPARMAATLHLPERPDRHAPILFLFPGATYSRAYFDLRFDGHDGYSQAEHHAASGHVVIAVDHLSTGDSDFGGVDPDNRQIHAACDAVVRQAVAMLRTGDLCPDLPPLPAATIIGIGQSMGGHVVVATQAEHRTFDAVAALGSSFTQTRLVLKAGHRLPPRDADPADIARALAEHADLRASFHWPETPVDLVERDFDTADPPPWRTRHPAAVGRSLLPHGLAFEAASVRVPVLLAYGQADVTPDPLADAAMFRSTADLSLRIFPDMGHMHNFAATRARLWHALTDFANRVAAERLAG